MKIFVLGLSILIATGCAQTINFRSSHFVTPFAGDRQWGGEVMGVFYGPTAVTVINDITTGPPTRNSVLINQNIDLTNILLLSNVSADVKIAPISSLDIFAEGSTYGLNWQFLNNGAKENAWVAAVRGGVGSFTSSSSQTSGGVDATASSQVSSTQVGLSVGYIVSSYLTPYISYLNQVHSVKTVVTNQHGRYGEYSDSGVHNTTAIGITSNSKGFAYGLEYNMINILWDRSSQSYQNVVGVRVGFGW